MGGVSPERKKVIRRLPYGGQLDCDIVSFRSTRKPTDQKLTDVDEYAVALQILWRLVVHVLDPDRVKDDIEALPCLDTVVLCQLLSKVL